MGRSAFRGLVSCVLMVLFPGSSFAADSNAAILYASGPTWINGSHVPRTSSAVFSGDLVQTRSDSVANINEPGSSVTVLADSLVQFGMTSLSIEHGGVTVSTSKGLSTTAGDITVAPASSSWTEFNVTDFDGTVRIAARKGDLTISDGQQTVTLPQGQETTRDDSSPSNSDTAGKKHKKSKTPQHGAPAAAGGGIMNSPWVIGGGAVAAGAVAGFVLTESGNPASPVKP